MEIVNHEIDIPYWDDARRKTIVDYSSIVVDVIMKHLKCSLFEAISIVISSGIYYIIAQDPEIASHRDPEEWIENVDAFIRRDLLGHNSIRDSYNSKAFSFSENGIDNKSES